MRRMKRNAASTMPISTATVRSKMTVSENVVRNTATSLFGYLLSIRNSCHSPMLKATIMSTALSVASGMYLASGAATTRMRSSVAACTMPAMGDSAPLRMLVAVRAIAPVAGIPPKKRRRDVGEALRHQLLVGVVPVVGGEQRLDRGEQREWSSRAAPGRRYGSSGTRARERAAARGDFAEAAANRFHRQLEERHDDRAGHDRHDGTRHPPCATPPATRR